MTWLTTSELDSLRDHFAETLPDTAQVQRRTLTPDGAGGYTESWSTMATVSCRVSPSGRSPDERAIAERLTATGVWTVTLPALTDVNVTDRLVVGSRTFEVVGVLAHSEEIGRRVVCTEVS